MRLTLAGHGLQLLGYTLTFCGLGVAAALFVSPSYPAVPFWVFLPSRSAAGHR